MGRERQVGYLGVKQRQRAFGRVGHHLIYELGDDGINIIMKYLKRRPFWSPSKLEYLDKYLELFLLVSDLKRV